MFEAWNVAKGRKVQRGRILSQGTVHMRWVCKQSGIVKVIWETKAIESADKNTVIDRVESLGQVDEDGCTVLSLIDGGYDTV